MSIDTKGTHFAHHERLYRLPKALLGGTMAMRAEGQTYLHKGAAEAQADYDYRLANTFLVDSYKRTLNYLTGQVFSKEPQLENASAEIEAFSEDVDKRGNNLASFAQTAFRAGIDAGMAFVYVDHDAVETHDGDNGPEYFDAASQTWKPRTMADAKAQGWGPYWVLVKADQVIDAWVEAQNGKPRLVQFRYLESVREQKDEWTQEDVEQIRVLTPGAWATYRSYKSKDGKSGWEPHAQGTTTMPDIPIAAFVPGEPIADFVGQPALMGLAELVLQHWQGSSGHRGMVDWLRRPILFAKCLSFEDGYALPAAPGAGIHSTSADASLEAINVVPPDAVGVSSADLQSLETKMGLYGLQLMMPRSGAVTASQIRRESAESDSALKRWADLFKDCLENALKFTAEWMGQQDGPSVTVNTEFSYALDDVESNTLLTAVREGIVPKEIGFNELKRRGLVQTDLDFQEAMAMMENERRAAPAALPAQAAASALLGQRQDTGSTAP